MADRPKSSQIFSCQTNAVNVSASSSYDVVHQWPAKRQRVEKRQECRRPWSVHEDERLKQAVAAYGVKAWPSVSMVLSGRTGKQCRERWHNHIDAAVKKDPWSIREQRMLLELQRKFGNRWADIARYLPGRTDNAIKNHWNSILRKGDSIDHLREGDGIPTAFPDGIPELPPSWQVTSSTGGAETGSERVPGLPPLLDRPSAQEAEKINALLRIEPHSTLASAVGFPVSAMRAQKPESRPALLALLATVRAKDKHELYTATVALQQAVRDSLSSLVADTRPARGSLTDADSQALAHELANELELNLVETSSDDRSAQGISIENGSRTAGAVLAESSIARYDAHSEVIGDRYWSGRFWERP